MLYGKVFSRMSGLNSHMFESYRVLCLVLQYCMITLRELRMASGDFQGGLVFEALAVA